MEASAYQKNAKKAKFGKNALPHFTMDSGSKIETMANVDQLIQLQTMAAYKRPLAEESMSNVETREQATNDAAIRFDEITDSEEAVTKKLKLALQNSSSRTGSMEEADELPIKYTSVNSAANNSAANDSSTSRNLNGPQLTPQLHNYRVPKPKVPARTPSAPAMQVFRKTYLESVFEDIYGEYEPKPLETQWMITQYRKDNDEGLLWMWTGRVKANRKIYMPAVRGTLMAADEDLQDADRMLVNRT